MGENKGKLVDQMMAALVKKHEMYHPSAKNPDGTEKNTKVRRGLGPVPNNKPQKRVTGRGR